MAATSTGCFQYPTGVAGLRQLGYPEELWRDFPPALLESFCGVGNPFNLGPVHPGDAVLDLGSGGGHNAAHLKATLACTLVDLAPAMLGLSRRLNPECEHAQGDMRSVRLERVFDCVLVHDAVSYMASRAQLASAIATAFEHTAPGGVALFQPDFVAETFEAGTETGGSDGAERGLRYLEWRWIPEGRQESYLTDMAYLLRDEGDAVEVLHDRHMMGLFSRAAWLELIAAAGFEPLAVPFEHSSYSNTGHEVFLGLHPVRGEGA